MPRISDDIRESVFYVYPSVAAAERGLGAGGSGFLVSVPFAKNPRRCHLYGVTNAHVVRGCKDETVLRLNRKDDQMAAIVAEPRHWMFHPAADDVAILPLALEESVRAKWIPVSMFITPDVIAEHDIGPGDDIFMVGRYVDHDGKQKNWPSLRFGNISMMNWEPVVLESGLRQEAFLVECKSVGGFSGSPVFVWIPPMAARPGKDTIFAGALGPWLLGVDSGHFPAVHRVIDQGGKPHPDGWRAKGSSGIAVVIPAWKINEVLDDPAMIEDRNRIEALSSDSSASPRAGGQESS